MYATDDYDGDEDLDDGDDDVIVNTDHSIRIIVFIAALRLMFCYRMKQAHGYNNSTTFQSSNREFLSWHLRTATVCVY